MKKLIKKLNAYQLYTLVFVILCIIIFFGFIKSGRSFIWDSDGLKQHYVFMEDLYNSIKNGSNTSSTFSWSLGLGLDKIGQLSYYILGDPFAYICLLFPIKYLKVVYSFLIILRMYCVGLSFILYCNYHKKGKFATLIGALIYTFSGFMLFAALRHPFFNNPVILLPLMFLGIDKILKEGKYKLFTIVTAVSAISNYYFFYMLTILTFIYAIVKYFSEYKDRGFKTFWVKFFKTVLCYLIGVMSAGILLLPTIYAFANNSRMSNNSFTYYDYNYYVNLFFMNTKTAFWSKTYVAPLALTILPIAILNFKKNKENRTYLINLLIQTIILLVPFLGSMMNGFSFQSNRWTFAYSFILAYIVTINIRKDLIYSPKEFATVKKYLIIYFILWFIFHSTTGIFPATSIAVAFIFLIIMVLRQIDYKKLKKEQQFYYLENYKSLESHKAKNRTKVILLTFLCIDILVFSYLRFYHTGYYKEFLTYSKLSNYYDNLENKLHHLSNAIDYVQTRDNSLYRVATNVSESNNESLMYNYHGLNTYLSIGNKYVSKLSEDLSILNRAKTNPLRELDSRTGITTFLGSKYYIASKSNANYVPYGYNLIKEIVDNKDDKKTACIYENKYALPIGVFYNNYTLSNKYETLSPLEKEQALLKTAVVDDVSDIKKYNISSNSNLLNNISTSKVNYELNDKHNIIKDNTIKITKKYVSFKLDIQEETVPENCELYLAINNLQFEGTKEYTVTANYNSISKSQTIRDKVTSPYYLDNPIILFNLGYRESHSGSIKVSFNVPGNYKFDSIELVAVPMNNYEQSIANLKQTEFVVINYTDNSLSGKINNSEPGILQISTSFSDGWKAYVDNKETPIINVNTGFIGIPLSQGNHNIKLVYNTPYLELGTKISIAGVALIFVIIIVDIVNTKRRKSKKAQT